MRRRPSLTPDEARELHSVALVIDTQQPPATSGFLFTETMRTALAKFHQQGMSREEAQPLLIDMATEEIRTSPTARQAYLDFWHRSGVTVACGTYSGSSRPGDAFEMANKRITQAHTYVDALAGELSLVRHATDVERIYQAHKHGLILDFQNTTPFGDDLSRVEHFYNLGIRMVQLTYNLRNLVGDGCTETYQGGVILLRSGHGSPAQRDEDPRRRQPLQRTGGLGCGGDLYSARHRFPCEQPCDLPPRAGQKR